MKFFESADGGIYPVANIDHMRRGTVEPGSVAIYGRVYLKEGGGFEDQGVRVHNETIDRIARAGGQCFAATPGFVVLKYCAAVTDEPFSHDAFVDELPVIGWRVDEYGDIEPLVFENEWSGMKENCGLRQPSGRITDIFGSSFDDRDAWIAEQERCAAAAAAAAEKP